MGFFTEDEYETFLEGRQGRGRLDAGKPTKPRKERDNPEDWLSAAVAYWLSLPEVQIRGTAFHVPNEQPSKARAGLNKWIGVQSGVADWIFTGPPLLCIELKIGKAKPTEKQWAWGARVEAGWEGFEKDGASVLGDILNFAPRYRICWTLAEAVSEVQSAGHVPFVVNALVEKVKRHFLIRHRRMIP